MAPLKYLAALRLAQILIWWCPPLTISAQEKILRLPLGLYSSHLSCVTSSFLYFLVPPAAESLLPSAKPDTSPLQRLCLKYPPLCPVLRVRELQRRISTTFPRQTRRANLLQILKLNSWKSTTYNKKKENCMI
jgi:hypothetical protein